MRSLFDFLTRTALRFRFITIIAVVIVMTLGGVATTQLQQELLPPIEFPQTFILAQVGGMTSDQALEVVTKRVESALQDVPDVVNIQSQTSGSFGAFIIVSNEFGIDQAEFRDQLRGALDSVYFPNRSITAPQGTDPQIFAADLINQLPADVLLYLDSRNPNFLFQLSPDIWQAMTDETARTLLAYLAGQVNEARDNRGALEQLIDAEVAPQIASLDLVANVQIAGGQALPGEESAGLAAGAASTTSDEPRSLLYQLSPDVWDIVSARLDLGALDENAVATLREESVSAPTTPPPLPDSWQAPHFHNASDLNEMASFTRSISAVFNSFMTDGIIRGPLGQTDDLEPQMVERMLAIEPTLATTFEAEQLAALSPEVIAVLPQDLEFDGFTRDALAAATLARDLTGEIAEPEPVNLPAAWRITPPQLITFSFADLPLATYSVFSTAATPAPDGSADTAAAQANDDTDTEATAEPAINFEIATNPEYASVPEGPPLPQLYTFIGDQFFNYELDTADDLLKLQFPQEAAAFLGGTDGAAFLNFLPQLGQLASGLGAGGGGADDAAVPQIGFAQIAQLTGALGECGIGAQDLLDGGQLSLQPLADGLVTCLDTGTLEFVAEYDPTFGSRLSADVYALLPEDVYAIDGFAPLLGDAWNTLAERPEFAGMPLRNADDVLRLGDGDAASVLNAINQALPSRFSGYEVRLFDSLSPQLLDYIVQRDPDFYTALDAGVLLKFSPQALASLSDDVLANFGEDVAAQAQAIANGEAESAAAAIASEYASEVPDARPDAPALNPDWKTLEGFIPGVTFDNAYDLIRFADAGRIGRPAQFINSLFDSPGGAGFASGLLGNLPPQVFDYWVDQEENFIEDLIPRALNLLPEEIFNDLPQSARDRAQEGAVFVPSTQVTRTNGAPSLLITIFKTADANTVQAFNEVDAIIQEINAARDDIEVDIAFEQASFIEESISGVVLSGLLGAFFAIVNILIFLSGDTWGRDGRNITGIVVTIISVILLVIYLALNSFSFAAIIEGEAVLLTALIVFGIGAGIFILLKPGRLPYPSWRSTMVIAVSIPLSIMAALALMRWLPGILGTVLAPIDDTAIGVFLLRLAPEGLTLNIMTLSGLTVAVGRLVDDSIVVLENIFRQFQSGDMEKREAVLYATRDVSVAIFSATSIAVLVFLPLGLTGGLIAEFFLPFGLAVTYTLLSSFLVAITVVPVLAYTFISPEHVPEEEETAMQRAYVPVLKTVLASNAGRIGIVVLALVSVGLSGYLFSGRPAAFLPDFGERQISISIEMPSGTGIIETNERAEQVEALINEIIPAEELQTVSTNVGGGGLNFDSLVGGGGVSENIASISISLSVSENFDAYTEELRQQVPALFTGEDESATVSAGSLSSEGFGGFELLLSGADQETLAQYNDEVIAALESLPELTNVTSNLASAAVEGGEQGPPTYIRVDGVPALTYTGELQTDDVINFTTTAIETVQAQVDLPEGVTVGQGFDSQLQTEGFSSIFVAMGIASVIIITILILVFQSPVYWLAVFFSVIVAPVGAAVALTLTDRVLGISSLIGLLMLLGLVVTNAIVLIDRVGSNRTERGLNLYDALIEAGSRRLRPIVMTALTTIIGLVPLALGLSEGAIIAAELGTVVIGGIISSTLLMLLVVPAAYYLFTPLHDWIMRLFGRSPQTTQTASKEK